MAQAVTITWTKGWRLRIVDAVRHALGRVTIVALLALLNPFEINGWADLKSASLWQRINADRYAANPPNPRPPGTGRGWDAITVVYLDDRALARQSEERPLSAYVLIDLLDDILAAGKVRPRAIFVDLLLTNAAAKRQTTKQLIDALDDETMRAACAKRTEKASPFQCLVLHAAEITRYAVWKPDAECRANSWAKLNCIRRSGGTPVIFADPSLIDPNHPARAAQAPSASLAVLDTVATVAPVRLDPTNYPLVDPADERQRSDGTFRLYPAAALYALWCADRCGSVSPVTRGANGLPAWSQAFAAPVAVAWGIGGAPTRDEKGEPTGFSALMASRFGDSMSECRTADPDRWVATVSELATAGINREEKTPCLYAKAVPYDIFQMPVTQDQMTDLLGDKLVLIGGQFADSNDVVDAAPFGQVPGVYYHAMALDNLIENGSNYATPAPAINPAIDMNTRDLVALLPLCIIAFFLALGRTIVRERAKADMGLSGFWPVLGSITRCLGIAFFFSVTLVAVLYIFTGQATFVPNQWNYVAVTLLCLLGVVELGWAALEPVRNLMVRHLAPRGFLRALVAPSVRSNG